MMTAYMAAYASVQSLWHFAHTEVRTGSLWLLLGLQGSVA
jgi:hypothetical protein